MGPIRPLPTNLDLSGKTVIITGSSAGLGLESARQFLCLKVSTLVLAVRDSKKGEAVKQSLLSDPQVQKINPHAQIKVMKLDLDDYSSIQAFRRQVETELPILDIVILNAGGMFNVYEKTKYSHERTVQLNYLSNALLLLELLPHLEASAEKRNSPSRVTWIGSRMSYKTTLTKDAWDPASSALNIFDTPASYNFQTQYSNSKYLCASFFYSLTARVSREKVIINMLCPGPVKTDLGRDLSLPVRMLSVVFFKVLGHSVEQAATCYTHAAAVAGPETHGRFLGYMDVEAVQPLILSQNGKAFQEALWNETIEELEKYTDVRDILRNL